MDEKNTTRWKVKMQEILETCQSEIKRTAEIGKKMISAGKTNTSLHESYEELGSLAVEDLKKGALEWDNPRVKDILETIDGCEKNLENIEKEVNDIRFSKNGDSSP